MRGAGRSGSSESAPACAVRAVAFRCMADSDLPGILRDDLLFARLAVEQGLAKPKHVEECLRLQADLAKKGEACRIGGLLARRGWLDVERTKVLSGKVCLACGERVEGRGACPKCGPVAMRREALLDVLGRYVRVAKLGAGGMGEVWRDGTPSSGGGWRSSS